MQIKLVPADSAGTVLAYYVSNSLPFFFLIVLNHIKIQTHSNLAIYYYSLPLINLIEMRQTLSFLAMSLGSHIFYKQIFSQMELTIERRGFICGLSQQRTSILIRCCGICTRLCKPSSTINETFLQLKLHCSSILYTWQVEEATLINSLY